jgi:cytochrome subunit of sulfide dehydrogenase
MTNRNKWLLSLGGLGLLAASVAVSAAPATPEMLSNACAGCHGTKGASAGLSMPSLAGQNKVAFVEAMKGFKTGERPASVMGRLAKGYSDEEIDLMADYFAKQKPHRPVQAAVDKKLAAEGKKVYNEACKRCHLENGKEFEENQPVVAGQWLKYLQIQTAAIRDGSRKISDKKKEKVEKLTAEQWEAMAHYYASIVK